ncbi:MAG: Tat pathway signal protein [Candidatus Hydrogenedentes bacterium]|nr:Tat pathway signal protein [Candidatus Hydrogenedentota bacterium]
MGGAKMIWADLLHLSYNMWRDWDNPQGNDLYINRTPNLRFDDALWNDLLAQAAAAGLNMIVIDLGDGVQYQSHPEIAVKGAWTTSRLKEELAKMRKMNIEPVPKMNFSATHDTWLGPYSRCLSTDTYYAVCRDLIAEAAALFDKPRFFHLGMDEETAEHQRGFEYSVIRQHDLWWRDFYFYVEQVEKAGSRPWIWSDYAWEHPDLFYKKMPKTVLQSNWYYDVKFGADERAVQTYRDLDQHGYDQIPTGSNWTFPESFGKTVDYCRKNVSAGHLLGFMQTSWKPTLEACRKRHVESIEQVKAARVSAT